MLRHNDEGPVYYREIQKNAFLKRIPPEYGERKLRGLGQKKPQLKPMWTQFCVHNGKTPYLEQYPDPEAPCALSHKPTWRVSLKNARHVTASVKAWPGEEFDFLVATEEGPVRMLAPDWDSMQDWVSTLRDKLHELRVLTKGENVYCSPPAPPAPRAGTRDPTSPLPPTPAGPPVRVPGIELATPARLNTENTESSLQVEEVSDTERTDRVSDWDSVLLSEAPGTSFQPIASQVLNSVAGPSIEPCSTAPNSGSSVCPSGTPSNSDGTRPNLAKICGQNICLDDSVLRRESDDVDFVEDDEEFRQTVLVNSSDNASVDHGNNQDDSNIHGTNITVIKVLNNRGAPHTAIPILGPETDVFDFDFEKKLKIQNPSDSNGDFINIVNTESVVNASESYGTVFTTATDNDYGHVSLTTVNLTDRPNVSLTDRTVNVTDQDGGPSNDSVYERLCMASTSKESPLMNRKLRNLEKFNEKIRKSSLPNLDVSCNTNYEYLFPCSSTVINPNTNVNVPTIANRANNNEENSSNSSNTTVRSVNTVSHTNVNVQSTNNVQSVNVISSSVNSNSNTHSTNTAESDTNRIYSVNPTNALHSTNSVNSVTITNPASLIRSMHCNIGRSNSQNNYDRNVILASQHIAQSRCVDNCTKTERNDKQTDVQKPIWKRGLTELSLLTRLRGLGQAKGRQESPTRCNTSERVAPSQGSKVVHRSRPEARPETARRRSSSLNNGQPAEASTSSSSVLPALVSLRRRQAASLVAEQARGTAHAARVPASRPPVFCDAHGQVWIACWGGAWSFGGRPGDRVAAVCGARPLDAAHARRLAKRTHARHQIDILFHRVPHGKIYVFNKDHEKQSIGIKLDSECVIVSVERGSPAARAGLPPSGPEWALTEVNNRPINLLKGGDEEMNRLASCGTEVSVLVQPAPLVKKLRAALRSSKPLLAR